jgi:hypothetical protein
VNLTTRGVVLFYPWGNELDRGAFSIPEAEALALLEVVQTASDMNMDNVIFESDAQAVLLIASKSRKLAESSRFLRIWLLKFYLATKNYLIVNPNIIYFVYH